MKTKSGLRLTRFREPLSKIRAFGRGLWRYWRLGEPAPESNYIVQKLYAYTDGRSNDILFRVLESKRKEADLKLDWDGASLVSHAGIFDPSIEGVVRTLKEDGVVVIPPRLDKEAVQNLYELALSCPLTTTTYGPLATDPVPGDNRQYRSLPAVQVVESTRPIRTIHIMRFLERYY